MRISVFGKNLACRSTESSINFMLFRFTARIFKFTTRYVGHSTHSGIVPPSIIFLGYLKMLFVKAKRACKIIDLFYNFLKVK